MDIPSDTIIKICNDMNITDLISFIETNQKNHDICKSVLDDRKQIIYDNFIKPYCVNVKGKRKTVIPVYFIQLVTDLLLNGVPKEDLFYLINVECVISTLPPDVLDFVRLLSNNTINPRIRQYIDDYLTHGKSNVTVSDIKPFGTIALMIGSAIVHTQ
jgi:hypothetical protein